VGAAIARPALDRLPRVAQDSRTTCLRRVELVPEKPIPTIRRPVAYFSTEFGGTMSRRLTPGGLGFSPETPASRQRSGKSRSSAWDCSIAAATSSRRSTPREVSSTSTRLRPATASDPPWRGKMEKPLRVAVTLAERRISLAACRRPSAGSGAAARFGRSGKDAADGRSRPSCNVMGREMRCARRFSWGSVGPGSSEGLGVTPSVWHE